MTGIITIWVIGYVVLLISVIHECTFHGNWEFNIAKPFWVKMNDSALVIGLCVIWPIVAGIEFYNAIAFKHGLKPI